MTLPDWIDLEENSHRNAGDPTLYRLALAARTDAGVNADHWHNWDYRLKLGTYELAFLSSDAAWLNYFVVGPVPIANQPQPVRPQERYGAILDKGPWHPSVRFRVGPETVVRIEAWVCVPDGDNPAPLPPGFDHWPLPIPVLGAAAWANGSSFRNNFQAVSRRAFVNGRLEFGMEDAGDGDFNDLVVALQRVGD